MYKIPRSKVLLVEYQEWLFRGPESLHIDGNSQARGEENACSRQRKKNEQRHRMESEYEGS